MTWPEIILAICVFLIVLYLVIQWVQREFP